MALAKKKCRVCGKEYKACKSSRKAIGVFEWQEVACCEDCGRVYLSQTINKRRSVEDAAVEIVLEQNLINLYSEHEDEADDAEVDDSEWINADDEHEDDADWD